MSINKQVLNQQLSAQGQSLLELEGAELGLALLDTCQALLQAASELDATTFEDWEQNAWGDGYRDLADAVLKGLNADQQQTKHQLEMNQETHLLSELSTIKQKTEALEKSNVVLQNDLLAWQKRETDAAATHTNLKNQLSSIDEDAITQLEKDNDKLEKKVTDLGSELKTANTNKDNLEKTAADLRSKIDDTKLKMAQLPVENYQLLEAYQKLNEQLQALKDAKETYSLENQAKLKEEIEAMKAHVDELKPSYDLIKAEYDQVNEATINYDAKHQTLYTDAIQRINSLLATLDQDFGSYESAIKDAKRRTASLEDGLTKMAQLRQELGDWFDNDQTPMDALLKVANEPENELLASTLDITTSQKVSKIMEDIRNQLMELDDFIKNASAAYKKDRKALLKKNKL